MMNRPSPLLLKSVEPSGSPSPLFFPLGESKVVDLFANNILHDIQQFKPKWLTRSNLSLDEWKSLTSLQLKDDIFIKPANKDSAVVARE